MAPCLIEENNSGPPLGRMIRHRSGNREDLPGCGGSSTPLGAPSDDNHVPPGDAPISRPPAKVAAEVETKAMTFYPTYEEFKDLKSFISFMESKGAHLAGIAKIVTPKEWRPRRDPIVPSELDITITTPLRQTIAPAKMRGAFSNTSHIMPSLSVKEFTRLATRPNYVTPPHQSYEELEETYWSYDKVDNSEDPVYGADVSATLTDPDCEVWNMGRLDSILAEEIKYDIAGVNVPYLYFGMWKATFAWHVEDMDLYGVNHLHYGAPKTWYTVPPSEGHKLEALAAELFPAWKNCCYNFLRHKVCMISPRLLARYGVRVHKMVQEQGDMMVVFPHAYHAGFNHGFNIAEAVNFAMPRWIEYGKRFRPCRCMQSINAVDKDRLTMEPFLQKYQPDRLAVWKKGRDLGPHPEDPPQLKEKILSLLNQEDLQGARQLANFRELEPVDLRDGGEEEEEMEVDEGKENGTKQFSETLSEEEFDVKPFRIRLKKQDMSDYEPVVAGPTTTTTPAATTNDQFSVKGKQQLVRRAGFKTVTLQEIQEKKSLTKCTKRHKMKKCRKCAACLTPCCGTCRHCVDMIKFGGMNKLKQKCVLQMCVMPTLHICPKCRWNL